MEYIEFNNNPKNKKTNDCAIRAISLASNTSWEDTFRAMSELALKEALMVNDIRLCKKYLKNIDYQIQKMPKNDDNKRYTVKEFITDIAEENEIYILKLARHLTVIKDKKLYDIWDCRNKCVGNYWVINRKEM